MALINDRCPIHYATLTGMFFSTPERHWIFPCDFLQAKESATSEGAEIAQFALQDPTHIIADTHNLPEVVEAKDCLDSSLHIVKVGRRPTSSSGCFLFHCVSIFAFAEFLDTLFGQCEKTFTVSSNIFPFYFFTGLSSPK